METVVPNLFRLAPSIHFHQSYLFIQYFHPILPFTLFIKFPHPLPLFTPSINPFIHSLYSLHPSIPSSTPSIHFLHLVLQMHPFFHTHVHVTIKSSPFYGPSESSYKKTEYMGGGKASIYICMQGVCAYESFDGCDGEW